MNDNKQEKPVTGAVPLKRLIMCTERLPEKSGEYEILNNSDCNSGNRIIYFDGKY
jgi:hypothetical protein